MQRYFVKKENEKIVLSDQDLHHIKDVMRIKSNGQIVCVFDNASYLCKIEYDNNSYDVKIIEEITKDVELPKDVILYQALIKNDKFDLVIQKATELGVSMIYPTIFSRSVVKVEKDKMDKKLDRYGKIVKEACEQSRRQVLPEMGNYINVKDIKLDDDTIGFIAYENNNNYKSFNENLALSDNYNKIAIVVGPEGGFSDDEVKYLVSQGFKNISLGKRILRSETASMYALSVIANYLEGK